MKKVLVVDDASFIRMMIKDALKNDFEIIGEADSVETAMALFQEKRPDVVTMDISLTGDVNGIEGLKQIKTLDANAIVVMVSSMGEEEYIKQSIDAGAAEFIVKPFSKDELLQTLKVALGI